MGSATFNDAGWQKAFSALEGPFKESLARRMLVSGGVLLRDGAKEFAPESDGPYNPNSRGSHTSGTLRSSIYLAYDEKASVIGKFAYVISWNAKKAWWGKLVEFGHVVNFGWGMFDGHYYSQVPKALRKKSKPGKGLPVLWRIPAAPFLGRSMDVYLSATKTAMIERGRVEVPILLKDMKSV